MTTVRVGGVECTDDYQDWPKWVLMNLGGWYDGPDVRGEVLERANRHGAFDLRGWRDARVITVDVGVAARSRAEAALIQGRLSAVLAEGTFGEFEVDDEDLGVLTSRVRLNAKPMVRWSHRNLVEAHLEFLAPDPLKYGPEQSGEAGFPVLMGGLAFDLFTDGGAGGVPGPPVLLRTNLCPNPSGSVDATGYIGTIAAANPTAMVDGDGAPFVRCTVPDTAANRGMRTPLGAVSINTPESIYSARLQVRGSEVGAPIQVRPDRWASATQNSTGPGTSITATGDWQDVDVALDNTTGINPLVQSMRVSVFYTGSRPVGSTLDVRWVLYQRGVTPGPPFDGDTPDTPTRAYAWAATPGLSTSTEHSIGAPVTVTGFLEFGEAGESGRVRVRNEGTAAGFPMFQVEGPTPSGFEIVAVGTGRRIRWEGVLFAGDILEVDPATGSAILNGAADRSGLFTRREWTPVPPGTEMEYLFLPVGQVTEARLTVRFRPAWW